MKPARHKSFFRRRILSFSYAFSGLRYLYASQPNFVLHSIFAILAIAAGFWLGISKIKWLMVILAIGMVMVAEAVNTAVELVVDFVSPEFHQLAGRIKDVAAASVLIAAMISLLIGLIIFGPLVWARF